jgi:hypothetical protein
VKHTAISTATTQQLDLEGMDLSGEFEARLWIRSDGLAFGSQFSFQSNIWSYQGMKPRGVVLVNPRLRKSSNPFSNTCRRIGTFVPRLLNTNISLKLTMLHCDDFN